MVAREGLKKHQATTSSTTIVKKFETELLGMLNLKDADSLTCNCGILGLDVPEQKKGNLKLLLLKMSRVTMMEVLLGMEKYTINF